MCRTQYISDPPPLGRPKMTKVECESRNMFQELDTSGYIYPLFGQKGEFAGCWFWIGQYSPETSSIPFMTAAQHLSVSCQQRKSTYTNVLARLGGKSCSGKLGHNLLPPFFRQQRGYTYHLLLFLCTTPFCRRSSLKISSLSTIFAPVVSPNLNVHVTTRLKIYCRTSQLREIWLFPTKPSHQVEGPFQSSDLIRQRFKTITDRPTEHDTAVKRCEVFEQ